MVGAFGTFVGPDDEAPGNVGTFVPGPVNALVGELVPWNVGGFVPGPVGALDCALVGIFVGGLVCGNVGAAVGEPGGGLMSRDVDGFGTAPIGAFVGVLVGAFVAGLVPWTVGPFVGKVVAVSADGVLVKTVVGAFVGDRVGVISQLQRPTPFMQGALGASQQPHCTPLFLTSVIVTHKSCPSTHMATD